MNPGFAYMSCSKMILLSNLLLLVSLLAVKFLKHFGTMMDIHKEMLLIKNAEIPQFSRYGLLN